MKKIYFLLLLVAHTGFVFAQSNPGNFEIRLVAPSGEPGLFRVQMRATGAVVPTNGDACGDLTFVIWWNNTLNPTIVDINVLNSIAGSLNEANPVPGNSSGSGTPNGQTVAISMGDPFAFPTSWVAWEWVHIADVSICSNANCSPPGFPAGMTGANFLIQGFNGLNIPNFNINAETDYTPGIGALPLNLIAFDARKSGDKSSHLTWTTVNEENTSHFLVQRSFDKKSWNNVGNVAAAGYSVDVRNYELTDLNVYNGVDTRREVYYRLIMTDLDGTSKPSPVRSVVFGNITKAAEFAVYPNPASNGVNVQWDANAYDQPTVIEFFDLTGKLVLSHKVADNSTLEYIDFKKTTIQPGLYMLRIMNGAEAIEHKQIVVGQR